MDLNNLTIKGVQQDLLDHKYSCVELVRAYIEQIENKDKNILAFLSLRKEQVLKEAELVDKKIAAKHPLLPLDGVVIALKDNLLIKGEKATSASKILADYVAPYSATVVEKLQASGAIIIGKTNLDEFAMGSSTENSAYQVTHNPWDLDRVPGGSSGGSAASVAADECLVAIGSDTGGSIRQPASLSGVVGFKPTYGQVSRHGLMAMASSLDQIGPIAKTVEDAAILYDQIKGKDDYDPTCQKSNQLGLAHLIKEPVKGLKVGIAKQYFIDGLDPQIKDSMEQVIDQMKGLGIEIIDVDLPYTEYALAVYYIIQPAEVSANLARFDGIRYGYRDQETVNLLETYISSRAKGLGAEVRRRIMLGTYVLSAGYNDAYYKKAQKVRQLIKNDFKKAFNKVDVLLTPASPCLPFKIGEKAEDPLTMYLADIFTVSANLAGIPGLVVPCGFGELDGKKLPIGMQLLGNHFDETKLFQLAWHYEQINKWYEHKP